MHKYPTLGFGLGLRPQHYHSILETKPRVDWFEIISEDYLIAGGKHPYHLELIREHYPIVMHGVSMSIGSCDPLDKDYLKQLKQLADRIQPVWVSDHLCWTGVNGINAHDLLPLPYTEEALEHLVNRVTQAQEYLGRQILLENVSSYISYQASEMTEWEFLTQLTQRADCLLLLDVNNIYVSAFNHGFKAEDFVNGVPIERVCQFHLAGHSNYGTHIIDTHDHDIIEQVWDLYAYALQRFKNVSIMIERDDHIPPLEDLVKELDQARTIAQKTWNKGNT